MTEYSNLQHGSVVPRTGKWECVFCGQGGMAEMMAKTIAESGLSPGKLSAHSKKGTVRFFKEGTTFSECPHCGMATGWSLLEDCLEEEHSNTIKRIWQKLWK